MSKDVKTAEEVAVEIKNELSEKAEASQVTELKGEVEKLSEKAEEATKAASKAIDEMNKIKAKAAFAGKDDEQVDLKSALVELLSKDDFKESKIYEVKADTSTFVTPIASAKETGVSVPRTRVAAILPLLPQQIVEGGKGTISWVEMTYGSNVGYVAEGASATSDTSSGVEKTREMAKISALIKVTEEMYEDKPEIAAAIESELYNKTLAFFDRQLVSGLGDDTAENKRKIYGLIGQATAFDATKAGVKGVISEPSIGDVVDAMKLQASVIDVATESENGGYTANVVVINPSDAMKWRATKDTKNQYIINRLADGTQVMGGLRVVETTGIGTGKLLVMESGIAELWIKRNFEIKVGQAGTDLTDDMRTIVLFTRAQIKVSEADKKGIIYVSDIDAAITALATTTP